MSFTADEEKRKILHKKALDLTEEKIFIANQLEETLNLTLINIKSSIIELKNAVNKTKLRIEPVLINNKILIKNKQSKKKNISKVVIESDAQGLQPPVLPIYCTCKKLNKGELIGCDNENCKIEWFHFECVGLKEAPQGQWFCDDCKSSNL